MTGETTLIVTTRSGVRPLGVRGEPLHNIAPQLRRVVRRRLSKDAADLLAEPQLHEDGAAIDWYAGWRGDVRPLSALDAEHRAAVLADIEYRLGNVRRLGDTLAAAGPREESGIVGLSLKLAARMPSQDFIFLVGERPAIVCWGYERDAAETLLPFDRRQPAVLQPAASGPLLEFRPVPVGRQLPAVRSPRPVVPWMRTLLAALPLLLLLLAAAWLLRSMMPADPDLALATRESPSAPVPPSEPVPDPLAALKAAFSTEEAHGRVLKVELSLIEAELRKRIAQCKPAEPPKPPQVALAPPPPAPAPPPPVRPAPAPAPVPAPPPPQSRPNDNRLRLPSGPSNDYSFMAGCWRTDPFRHETLQSQPGVSTYCFDASGNGQLEWRRGPTACRTRAQSRYDGMTLRLRDNDTHCTDGSRWYADQLVCRRGADNVAQCSGTSNGAYGPVSWTVNLHKLN